MSLIFNVDIDNSAMPILEEIAFRVVHAEPLMNKIGDIVYDLIADNFEGEHDSNGSPWADLAPSTIKARTRKGYTPITKLRASGKGERAITLSIASNTLRIEYGGGGTDYMQYHRSGTSKMPKRDFIPSEQNIERNKAIADAVARHVNPRGFN